MTVNSVYLDGFRNYCGETAGFHDGVNVISGCNAQGKTNLIEAVYYLTCGRSFRSAGDKELISHERDEACIRASVSTCGREQTLQARIFRGKRREFTANGAKLNKASELSGRFTAVVFGPDDLGMIKDGAAVRRKLMDQRISQLRPGYLAALMEFTRLYEHKTRILRDHREKPALLDLLDDFDLRLGQQSAKLIQYRAAFTASLAARVAAIYNEFTGGRESIDVRYKTVGGIDAAGKKAEELLPLLLDHQREHRRAELSSGACLSGAHKDDLEIDICGTPARKYASQGQMRTAAVSIKLAEREMHFDDSGEYPVLLLDDVLSELDRERREFMLGKAVSGQVIITCCEELRLEKSGVFCIQVEKGKLLPGGAAG